uniref:Protoporphyrinogen oxidase n=1 Tax=Megaselia scalaris TaxID=36166 RepID=T1GCU6_MEGSC
MPVVLGGGIGGLSAAYYLSRKHISPIKLFEKSNRYGGWIKSENHRDKGYIFECGPRTLRTNGPAAANSLQLIQDLELNDAVVPVSRNTHKLDDESIFDFTERRFGKEVAQYLISPMICGICAGDAKKISVKFLMKEFFEAEQKHGGVFKGLVLNGLFGKKVPKESFLDAEVEIQKRAKEDQWNMILMKNGLEMIPKRLVTYLNNNNVSMDLNSECRKLTFYSDKSLAVHMTGKEKELTTDHIISALPSYKLASCVEEQHPSLAFQLRSIEYVDVAVVNLQYATMDLLDIDAFGFLVPPSEQRPILGVIFDSCCSDMSGNTVLTVMMGGEWFQDYFGSKPDPAYLLNVAKSQVKDILNISMEPKNVKLNILKKCIPQYTLGHYERVEAIRKYIDNYNLPLTLVGALMMELE